MPLSERQALMCVQRACEMILQRHAAEIAGDLAI